MNAPNLFLSPRLSASIGSVVLMAVVLCFPVLAQITAPETRSLVEDASFEASTTATLGSIWSSAAGSTLEVEQFYAAKSGSKYLEVNGTNGNVDVQVDIGAYTNESGNHALLHGRTYQIGVWVGVANTRDQQATLLVQRKNQAGNYYNDLKKTLSFTGSGNANQTIGWHYVRGVYHFEDNDELMDANDASTVRLSLSLDDTAVFFIDQVEVYELYPDSMKSDGLLVIDDTGFAAGALRIIMVNSGWANVSGYFELNPGEVGDAANAFDSDLNGLRCTNTFLGSARGISYTPDVLSSPHDWEYYKTTATVEWPVVLGTYEIRVRGGAYKLEVNAAQGYAYLKSTSGRTTTLDFAEGASFSTGTEYDLVFALQSKTVGGTIYDDITVTVSDGSSTLLSLAFDASDPDFSEFDYLGEAGGGGVVLAVKSAASYTKSVTIEDGGGIYDSWNFETTTTSVWDTDWIPGALETKSFPEEKVDALLSFDPSMDIIYAYKLNQTTVNNQVPIGSSQAEIDKRAEVKANILGFLDALGDKISIFQVDNETMWTFPAAEHTTTAPGDDYVRSVEWLRIVAGWVDDWRNGVGGNPDLKISTGAIIMRPSLHEDLTPATSDKFLIHAEDMIKWANEDPNVDLIDVHLFPVDKLEMESSLAWLRHRVEKPLICTEWSQQGGSDNFIYNPADTNANATKLLDATFRNNSVLYAAGLIDATATNADYVQAAYKNPVPQGEFDDFVQLAIDSGDIDYGFIQDAFDLFNRAGVVYPCYAIHNQYSNAHSLNDLQTTFNMLQLWGNLSIRGKPVSGTENTLEFQALGQFRDKWMEASSRVLPGGLLTEHRFDGTGHTLQTSGSGTHTVTSGRLNINTLSGSLNVWDNTASEEAMRVEATLTLNSYNATSSGVGIFAKRDSSNGERYSLVYRMHTGQLALSVTDGGTTTDLALQAYTGLLNHPAQFRLEVAEPLIRAYVDHELVFEVTDSTHVGQAGAGGAFGWGADFDLDVLKIQQGRASEDVQSGVAPHYSWSDSSNGSWTINSAGKFEQTVGNAGSAFRYVDWVGGQTDYSVRATVTPRNLANGGSIGLVSRYDSSDNSRYEFVYQPGTPRLALRKVDSGTQTLLRTMDMTGKALQDGFDYDMELEVAGQQIKAYWEGFLVFSYHDATPGGVTTGLPGLHTYLCRGEFDDLAIESR